jgi:3-oxoadipate enol-lactonase
VSTVVLCGSLGSTAAMWEEQLPVLADRDVVVVEHPGHGAAAVGEVAGVTGLAARTLAQVDADRFAFVGLSLGGAVGMQLALDAPGRVEKLVLACTSARFGDPQQWLDRATTVRDEGLEAIVDAVLARWFVEQPVARWREMFLSVDAEGYARCCEAIAAWDARDLLARIEAPTLAIAGDADPSTPPEQLRALAEGIPDARLEVLPNAAHLANIERAEAFNRLLEEWL